MWSPLTSYIRCMWSGVHGVHLEFLRSIWSPGEFQVEFGCNLAGLSAKENPPEVHLESISPGGVHWIPPGIYGGV